MYIEVRRLVTGLVLVIGKYELKRTARRGPGLGKL